MKLPILVPALALLAAAEVRAFSYPALDTTSHWSIQDFGFTSQQGFYVQGAEKNVWIAPGQAQARTVFYNLAVQGARKNGEDRKLSGQDFMGELQGDAYIGKYGSFKVDSDVSLVIVLFFMDDGKFEATAYFTGGGYSAADRWDVVFRVDYDLAGADNNTAEFLWNGGSEGRAVSPPQYPRGEVADGILAYSDAPGNGPAYWAASAHEMTVAYPPLPRESGEGVENAGFARILNASNPQFGMVLWGHSATPIQATFKAYTSNNGALDPGADISIALQSTGESGNYPRYAYAGRDQLMFLKLNPPVSGGTYQFGGKLFQRSGTRPLSVGIHQHDPARLDGFAFNPDMVVRYTDKGARTFRKALSDLIGSEEVTVTQSGRDGMPYLPFDGYAQPGQAVTEAQLHNLMRASRDRSQSALENVREWRLDLYLVDWTLQGEPGVWEAMFDYGGADANAIAREGAAVFWPALAGAGEDYQRRQSVLSALHAAGLAFNMDPSWSACSFAGYCWNDASACGGKRCGSACPPGSQGCGYHAYDCIRECADGDVMSLTDIERNSIRFGDQAPAGSGYSGTDWYRFAPEAWVKPGRFGAPPVSGPMPPFIRN
ncbi:MAG TPA: hypothetical protein VJ385_00135 [Fibrobacteria bacterium]|nr:hypothetical protein [Fibrobacteria bacterium]